MADSTPPGFQGPRPSSGGQFAWSLVLNVQRWILGAAPDELEVVA